MNPVEKLVNHWKTIYNSEDPAKELQKYDGEIPEGIRKDFQFKIYPEPFYGYLNEDMSKDGLLLLLNPGWFDEVEEQVALLNEFTKQRYTTWTKKDYVNEELYLGKVNPESLKWREVKKKQFNRNIPISEGINFLHTMELFPYHSKNWKSEEAISWLMKTETTKLNFAALKYIAENRKVNYLFGIGIDWVDIFKMFGYDPVFNKDFKNENENTSCKVYQYQLSKNATPIIIYSGAGMHLPVDQDVVALIKTLVLIENTNLGMEDTKLEEKIASDFDEFGDYAAIAERMDSFILEGMGYHAYRMKNIKEGIAYHEKPERAQDGFAKIGFHDEPFLLLRFGSKSDGGHLGIVKQIEFDRKLGSQTERPLSNIKEYPNETFIYFKYLIDNDNENTWKLIEENIKEAYKEYYLK